jgi:co-chaperonin GroES (HSP10)
LAEVLKRDGTPTENRVLILSPKDQDTQVGGLIIPGTSKEGVPREGVVIFPGPITEDYITYKGMINTGVVITYGLYAGKEVDLWEPLKLTDIELTEDKWEFTVLALNEIIYVRENKNV